ncbi:hypothetical protein PGTUg99_016656 [Puccinia graminis f. sp. tritici]|uniref:Uncharacterized protein n=1 Tax=Puccinia graminis f. sp. tritici TaxID=56615 RepID=A0A5B0RDM7_PUCGR|nr:hypothetical protein PGTUg99_016656 [Puccinia graminis f. sp. tritici]
MYQQQQQLPPMSTTPTTTITNYSDSNTSDYTDSSESESSPLIFNNHLSATKNISSNNNSSTTIDLFNHPLLSDEALSKSFSAQPTTTHQINSIHKLPPQQKPQQTTPIQNRFLKKKRRWMRSLNNTGLSLRSLKKLSGPRLPLGILLGLLLFISFAVSLTIFLIHYLDTDKEPLPWRTFCQEQREFPHELADSLDPVNVFVGVFSVDSAYERRHLIRSTYARHSRPIDPNTGQIAHNVQLKFILGRPRIQHVRRVALEMETYNDIVVLDIQENMNRGKTHAFLNWASQNATIPVYFHPLHEPKPKTGVNGIGGVMSPDGMETINVGVGFKKADFIVKADDDSFIVLSELERHLRVAPRTMTYWGYLIRNLFMGGECYALSADLVRYVASSKKVLDHVTGAEDKKVAKWMRIHPNASQINWVTERCWIYDHPKAGTTYAHGFLFPDEVQRVRAEGRVGLSEAELEVRGPDRAQSYSTVNKWKERYVAPKSMMTMEEEVEALVEGGGRFTKTDWKRPTYYEDMVPLDKVLFESDDERLQKSSLIGGPASIKPPSSYSRPGEYTPPVRDHYEEPSLKFGRPPSELMAKMPAMEDLPESPLKDKLRQGMAAENDELKTRQAETEAQRSSKPATRFIPSPTLRFDPEEMRLRDARFLHRPHGGTVVVHYLKRSEWFLETSLILLGRAKTWDDGLTPLVYEPTHQMRAASRDSLASAIQPEGHSVVVSEKAAPSTSNALSTLADNPSSSKTSEKNQEHTKKIEVGRNPGWGKFDRVEEIQVGGLFGGARLTGSPVIDKDGAIREGRKPKLHRPPTTPASDPSLHHSSLSLINKNSVTSRGPEAKQLAEEEVEKEEEEEEPAEQKNEIRKTQFGGAGWIRGKPRLRVADHADGPQFATEATTSPGPTDSTTPNENHTSHQNSLQDEHEISEEEYLVQANDSSLVLGNPSPPSKSATSIEEDHPVDSMSSSPSDPVLEPSSNPQQSVINEDLVDHQHVLLPPSSS